MDAENKKPGGQPGLRDTHAQEKAHAESIPPTVGAAKDAPTPALEYVAAGWALVPLVPGGKRPAVADWNREENTIRTRDQAVRLNGDNIGLALAYSRVTSVDVDDYLGAEEALKSEGIDLDKLLLDEDAVQIRSGKENRAKLLYRLPANISPLPTVAFPHADGHMLFELRCATWGGLTVQDVLPPSIHPDTNQPYQWGGYGDWRKLPELPEPILELWHAQLADKASRGVSPPIGPDDGHQGVVVGREDAAEALAALDPDMARADWLRVGMALHSTGATWALDLWHGWSARGKKFHSEKDINDRWRSFRPGGGITILTLFRMARDAGWKPPRQAPPAPGDHDFNDLAGWLAGVDI